MTRTATALATQGAIRGEAGALRTTPVHRMIAGQVLRGKRVSEVRARLDAAKAAIEAGDRAAAAGALRQAEALDPPQPGAWRAIGNLWHAAGDPGAGGAAHLHAVSLSVSDPELIDAAAALAQGALDRAETRLRARLHAQPTDVAAIRMMAELAGRLGRWRDAETLLRRALALAPGFAAARHNLALVLHRHGRPEDALAEIDALIAEAPEDPSNDILKAAILGRSGDYDLAVDLYRTILAEHPRQAKVWMSLGHALKTVGEQAESVEAYRRSIALEPGLGGSWWSLANLKTWRFTPEDADAMRGALADAAISHDDRFHLHFALGKAEEDAGHYAESFAHYAEGNRLRRAMIHYDADETSALVDRQLATQDAAFFAARAGWGCQTGDPIFVVSLPRAGSTLVEQILASHSQVEGTMELPDIAMLAGRLGPGGLAELDAETAATWGQEYLDRTRVQRKAGTPRFVDKMPNNWLYAGLIQLILPNATIVDARRHPLSCGFSLFKQHFAHGQAFSYDLTEIGRYYADYVRAMAGVDAALPGRVHRVIYERMVEDTEAQVRALLAAAGLAFEPGCLDFHKTERAVRTASSEQVRRPIFREGMEQWQHFAPWLGPIEAALGPVLASYPDVPRP